MAYFMTSISIQTTHRLQNQHTVYSPPARSVEQVPEDKPKAPKFFYAPDEENNLRINAEFLTKTRNCLLLCPTCLKVEVHSIPTATKFGIPTNAPKGLFRRAFACSNCRTCPITCEELLAMNPDAFTQAQQFREQFGDWWMEVRSSRFESRQIRWDMLTDDFSGPLMPEESRPWRPTDDAMDLEESDHDPYDSDDSLFNEKLSHTKDASHPSIATRASVLPIRTKS
ncbi:hypothetical protein BJ508DRAFT_330628 [Ascobolus immersus RN42]|uniref:Uncharacterized protein n=1 Tax=Ascobolus immersus RN42 TaxID=1160509 RepID=A0A3N4HUM6_ASCIM|nr:hypothetical protein BJ508DRAFT_330628 [Ascobolus immersus RN42]